MRFWNWRCDPGRQTKIVFADTGGYEKLSGMKTLAYTYWKDGKHWLGYLDEFSDYMTQGTSLSDLKAHLVDLYRDLTSGEIPSVRRHAELELA
jgi:hypothetical protein